MTLPSNLEGRDVPDVVLRVRRDAEWADVSTAELFGGKNAVVFSLPGAFTPTCSSTHLPRYNELAPAFRKAGIDTIVCVAVNDPFVMEEWGRSQESDAVLLLPDGNGAFTDGMGMLVDKSPQNLGKRSWRYSMLVRNARIEKMFIEADREDDPLEVSDADTMLDYLDPRAVRPDQVAVLSRIGCPHCAKAKKLLTDAGYAFVELPLGHASQTRVVGAITGGRTVPQVFVNGELIGGADEVEAWLERGLKKAA